MFYVYMHVFRFMRCLHVSRNLKALFCLTKCCQIHPNYLPVYMEVNYFFNMCLLNVWRLLCKLAIPKIFVSSVFCPIIKEICYASCEIEHKMCYPGFLLNRVYVWDYAPLVHSRVSYIKFLF